MFDIEREAMRGLLESVCELGKESAWGFGSKNQMYGKPTRRRHVLTERERGIIRCVLSCVPDVTAYFGPPVNAALTHGRNDDALVFEIPDREHRSGVSFGHACSSGVAREGMTMTRPRGQCVEKVVI